MATASSGSKTSRARSSARVAKTAKAASSVAAGPEGDPSGNGRPDLSLVKKRDEIVIRGAREHNLKNITVAIPRDKMTTVTGVSGSGKSSLVFSVLFSEGQRRYVESLSSYARQFLQQMEKPDVDSIEGLSPAIAIDQKTTSRNPRSTVGTVTEIYDYLRLLYARVGRPHCPVCGRRIEAQSIEAIVDHILTLPVGAKFTINAPVVRDRKGEHKETLERLRNEGFTRVKIDGEEKLLEDDIQLDKKFRHDIEVVVDRLVLREDLRVRLTDSIETASQLSEGLILIDVLDTGERRQYSLNFACPEHGVGVPELEPRIFSFNAPQGACPRCTGLGFQQIIDPDLLVPDPSLSINEGALLPWSLGSSSGFYRSVMEAICEAYGVDPDTPWQELTAKERNYFLYGTGKDRIWVSYRNAMGRRRQYMMQFGGVLESLKRRYDDTDSESMKQRIEEYMSEVPCPDCQGARLRPEVLAVTVGDKAIHEFTALSVERALEFVDWLPAQMSETERLIGERVVREIKERLTFLNDVGVGYLTLDRAAATLSGGEAQRLRLATQIGSQLQGIVLCLDEPSIGLHERDNHKLIDALHRLRDQGSTVVVVEHDEECMWSSDTIVDLGLGAGEHGGEVIVVGTPEEVANHPESITGAYLSGRRRISLPERRTEDKGTFKIIGAAENNLKNIDVEFPIGKLICVTGVSGSGKSTLIGDVLHKAAANKVSKARVRPGKHTRIEGLEHFDKVIEIDQRPIGRTPRSNPATYTDLFTHIRELYSNTPEAKVRGYKPGRFSFNVPNSGRCEACRGDGYTLLTMLWLPDVEVPCPVCHGRRYNQATLEVHFKGKNIADVLDMSVEEALAFFSAQPKIQRRLQTLHDVGLGYIKLGQPATQLSGGEAQRVKLAAELARRVTATTLLILDEPTTGLAFADIQKLLDVLHRLVDNGATCVVIEHQLDVISNADYCVDLGKEGGEHGGELIAIGTPEEIAEVDESYTGQFLKPLLERKAQSESSSATKK